MGHHDHISFTYKYKDAHTKKRRYLPATLIHRFSKHLGSSDNLMRSAKKRDYK